MEAHGKSKKGTGLNFPLKEDLLKVPDEPTLEESNIEGFDNDYLCGIGQLRPHWLQRFANPRAYGIVFGLLGISQGAFKAYMVGTLSSVEKRFSINSQVSSVILMADGLSPLVATVVFLLFLRRTSMPNWISAGMLLSLIGALVSSLPYAVFGAGTHLLELSSSSHDPGSTSQFCSGNGNQSDASKSSISCQKQDWDLNTTSAVVLLFLGNFLNGLGGVACYVVGATYMDDNVKKKNSALYFGEI
ncbi:hypothetical protein HPB48_022288 [Haemaphysalis longicornis]|uniref:Uncharacterized protein n=1 Tax=Haemaphysalis longicornis TaxID=44386 RepID=A0A9J6FPC8_HAELO|nr:hypothetical protein HPB48_022288 [Haemaphysalis longicornis]